jgi:pimeloyl-ACP methyl ester carboxylesterase
MKVKLKVIIAAAAIIGLTAIGVFHSALRAQETARPRSVWDGVYTEEQARRGESLYGKECASCHREDSGGEEASALAGPAFLANWDGLTVGDLCERIRVSMPPDNPRRLSRRQITDILGHMLKLNGFPAGKTELAREAEAQKQIRIVASKPKASSESKLQISATDQQPANTNSVPPPGKLVDVGGWRIHLNCTGENKPNTATVVLEAGWGDFSFTWSLVQPVVARFTRVCSYDRAGKAWSDLGPRPRTMKQVAFELRTALANLDVKPPYVLVGHSYGGLIVRTFASQHPKEVVGMVLVDSSTEDAMRNLQGKILLVRELSQGRVIPPIQTSIAAADKTLTAKERQEIERFLKRDGPPKIQEPFNRLPLETQQARLWALAQPERYAADDYPYDPEEFAEIYAARKAREDPLGDIPLVVLSLGKYGNLDTEAGRERHERMKGKQLDLLRLSRNSKQVIAESSGHFIQLDEPALVVDAIRQVVDSALQNRKLTP